MTGDTRATDAWEPDTWDADDAINTALGIEVRALRDAAGLSRREFVEGLPFDLHMQTLQNYEHGLRQFPLGKLEVIARELGASAEALIGRAMRAAKSRQIQVVYVNLFELRDSPNDESDVELTVLQRWARNRRTDPRGVARVPWTVVEEIAAAVGSTAGKLARRLEEFQAQEIAT